MSLRDELLAKIDVLAEYEAIGLRVAKGSLGTFKPATRAARTYSAPLTDKPVKKPATNTVRFKVTADLKRACNE